MKEKRKRGEKGKVGTDLVFGYCWGICLESAPIFSNAQEPDNHSSKGTKEAACSRKAAFARPPLSSSRALICIEL